MNGSQLFQLALPQPGQFHEYAAAVLLARPAIEQFRLFQAIHQADGVMSGDLELLGELADTDLIPARKTFDGEKRLILQGGQIVLMGGFLAEAKKFPQFVAK